MSAPFYADLAEGPEDGFADWAEAADGRRIRIGAWGLDAPKGTVFLFPGRSEYIEKYGRSAEGLRARGYATVSIDWRGQGLASRVTSGHLAGHVGDFAEFQLDAAAMIAFARAHGLPEPWQLLCHSMGGCIGLRTLLGPHPFKAAAFSAPMWGIKMTRWQRPMAEVASTFATRLGAPYMYAPSTGPIAYVTTAPFLGNVLTTDPDMWAYMVRHLKGEPKLAMGGPTMGWLRAALNECSGLARAPSPDLPAYVGLGTHERVVDPEPIKARMPGWRNGRLDLYQGDEHEILMERDRDTFLDRVTELFNQAR
jgi:lysophospholipase